MDDRDHPIMDNRDHPIMDNRAHPIMGDSSLSFHNWSFATIIVIAATCRPRIARRCCVILSFCSCTRTGLDSQTSSSPCSAS